MELENQQTEEQVGNEAPSIEEEAMSKGWRPLEEWDGDPDQHIGAKEFLDREPFFERIKSQSSEIKRTKRELAELKETIKELSDHHQRVRETEYKRAMEDLKARRREAFESGDYERLETVEDKMKELEEIQQEEANLRAQKSNQVNTSSQGLPQEIQDWVDENTWYNEDPVRRAVLDACLQQVIDNDPTASNNPRKALEEATKLAKREIPGRFGLERVRGSAVVEPGDGASRARSGKSKYSARHLSDDQKAVGKRFIATGAIKNLDEYAQQLAAIGGLDI